MPITDKDYLNQIRLWLMRGLITPQQLDELAREEYARQQEMDNATIGLE